LTYIFGLYESVKWGENMKRCILWVIVIVFCFMILPVNVFAGINENSEPTGFDCILVIDTSGSMKNSDPDRITTYAAQLFIDMCEISDTNLGLIAFSDQIETKVGFTSTQDKSGKEMLKETVNNLTYSDYTDIGLAMQEAQAMAEENLQKNPDRKTVIVFFSDGKTSFESGGDSAVSESNLKRDTSITYFDSVGIPVNTLGLDSDNSANRDDLMTMASSTGGISKTVKTADEIPDFFNEIFAATIESKVISLLDNESTGEMQVVQFNVDNPYYLESNIVILTKDPLQEVHLIDPSGNEIDLLNSENAIYSHSDIYALIKLLRPAPGTWTLQVRGVPKDQIRISMINSFNVDLVDSLGSGPISVAKNDIIDVAAYLQIEQQRIKEDSLYDGVQATIYILGKGSDTSIVKLPMTYFSLNTQLEGQIVCDRAGEFDVYCELVGNDFARTTPIRTIIIQNDAPIVVKKLSDNTIILKPSIFNDKGKTTNNTVDNAKSYFSDANGDALTIALSSDNPKGIQATYDSKNDKIQITPLHSGEYTITVFATDDSGATVSLNANYKVVDLTTIIFTILAVLFSILIIGFIVAQKLRPRFRYETYISFSGNDQYPAPQLYDLRPFGKRKISLLDLLNRELQGEIYSQKLKDTATKIKLIPYRTGFKVYMKDKTKKNSGVNIIVRHGDRETLQIDALNMKVTFSIPNET